MITEMVKTAMLYIPAGEFEMGISIEQAEQLSMEFVPSGADRNPYIFHAETPAHHIKLSTFQISKFEVTNIEYRQFIEDDGYKKQEFWKALIQAAGWGAINRLVDHSGHSGPASWINGVYAQGKDLHPVDGVSWYEANAFCIWKKLRLPSEAEWEYAARGTDGRIFPWGNDVDVSLKWGTRQAGETTPVGLIEEDKSPFGVMDLAGNVSEWVFDTWMHYPDSPFGPAEIDEEIGIVRGGMFLSIREELRATRREKQSKWKRIPGLGFRCVK